MNLKWRHIEWIKKDRQRYLRITVDGKTGNRQLIARVNTMDYLKRIQERFADLNGMDFDALLTKRVDKYVFRLADGTRTNSLAQTFEQLMRDTGLAVGGSSEQQRTLYSLRHTYATFRLEENVSSYLLAKNMGTSVKMLEQFYGHTVNRSNAAELTKTRGRRGKIDSPKRPWEKIGKGII